MLRKIRKTDLVAGIALGAIVGFVVCALVIDGLYLALPEMLEHALVIGRITR